MLPEVATGNTYFLGTHLKTYILFYCYVAFLCVVCVRARVGVVGNEAWPVVA